MTEDCCGNCVFALEISDGILDVWKCRRYPPTIHGAFPATTKKGWCGEHE